MTDFRKNEKMQSIEFHMFLIKISILIEFKVKTILLKK